MVLADISLNSMDDFLTRSANPLNQRTYSHIPRPLPELNPDCWICKRLHEHAHLIFFESRASIGKLNLDQFFKGYSFVTLKWHSEELYQLSDTDRKKFLEDMSRVARALSEVFKPDKMNYELLGNGIPHLHWHLVPRYHDDPFWGRPIWSGSRRQKRLSRESYEETVTAIKNNMTK
jgi:diadenosine tetraphosphate (Ap4A) HIT family hydrolase